MIVTHRVMTDDISTNFHSKMSLIVLHSGKTRRRRQVVMLYMFSMIALKKKNKKINQNQPPNQQMEQNYTHT